MAGASRMRAARRSASSTATSISARRSPTRSTASASANRWSRARSPPSIRAASMPARRYYDKASTVYYPFDLDSRQGRARQGRAQGYRRQRHRELPGRHRRRRGRRDHAARQRRLPDRQEPCRRRHRPDGTARHPRDRSTSSAGTQHDATQNSRQVRLADLPQRFGADLRGAEHRRPRPDRPADQRFHRAGTDGTRRPAAVRAGDGRHRQQVHRHQRQCRSAPT